MTTIKLKNGSGAPTAGDLVQGEPALDLTNKRLYTEDSGGTVIEVGTNPGTDVTFADNRKAIFGAGSDLQIYHSGTGSYIEENGTGNLFIEATNLRLKSASGENYIAADQDGAVTAYYDNTARLATTSTGIDVTGGIAATDDSTFTAASGSIYVTASTPTGAARSGFRVDETSNNGFEMAHDNADNAFFISRRSGSSTVVDALKIDRSTGDFSLFEDTGTTAKLFWDASAESLGIGTSSPDTLLHLSHATGSAVLRLERNDTAILATDQYGAIEFEGQDANAGASGVRASMRAIAEASVGQTSLTFSTAGSSASEAERMRIDSSGQVGIGTSSPARQFHLHDSSASYLHLTNGTTGSTANDGASISMAGTSLQISNRENGVLQMYTNGSEPMRIDSSGNVGIGTSSPDNKLHVYKGANGHSWSFDTGDAFIVENNDSVSINLATPSANSANILFSDADARGQGRIVYDHSSDYMGFHTAGVGNERMRIDSSGNVKIGTNTDRFSYLTATTANLQIDGGVVFEPGVGNNVEIFNYRATDMLFGNSGAEDMRIDSSGNLLVGTTSSTLYSSSSETGTNITSQGGLYIAHNGTNLPVFNRITSDGDIVDFRKNGAVVGSIAYQSHGLQVNGETDHSGISLDAFAWVPLRNSTRADNTIDLGTTSYRFDDIYATNGTIQTSDRNEKQDIEELSDAEQRVAVAAKGLLRKFRWIDSVEEKGDEARIHFGIIAQDLQDAFTAEGLDAGRYAMFINSTWTDEETGEERSRMGVRYSELLAFIIAAI